MFLTKAWSLLIPSRMSLTWSACGESGQVRSEGRGEEVKTDTLEGVGSDQSPAASVTFGPGGGHFEIQVHHGRQRHQRRPTQTPTTSMGMCRPVATRSQTRFPPASPECPGELPINRATPPGDTLSLSESATNRATPPGDTLSLSESPINHATPPRGWRERERERERERSGLLTSPPKRGGSNLSRDTPPLACSLSPTPRYDAGVGRSPPRTLRAHSTRSWSSRFCLSLSAPLPPHSPQHPHPKTSIIHLSTQYIFKEAQSGGGGDWVMGKENSTD